MSHYRTEDSASAPNRLDAAIEAARADAKTAYQAGAPAGAITRANVGAVAMGGGEIRRGRREVVEDGTPPGTLTRGAKMLVTDGGTFTRASFRVVADD